jgi:hypothetical protein
MYKVMMFLKRKSGITFAEFQNHYETSHAVLGQKYLGHLLQSYTRNYNRDRADDGKFVDSNSGVLDGPFCPYDCVTEWILADEAAFMEAVRILSDPSVAEVFREDERLFLDQTATLSMRCEVRDVVDDTEEG